MSSTESVYLCIDAGTQSLRASIIDTHGRVVTKSKFLFDPPDAEQLGWAEYSVGKFWHALISASRQAVSELSSSEHQVRAIGITCQRSTVINLDKHGVPLRPAILWSDQRRTNQVKPIGGLTEIGMNLIGVGATVRHFQKEAEANWIWAHQPEVWRATEKFLFLSGYLNFRLTNQFVDSSANQVGFVPFNFKRQEWASPRQWQWRALPPVQRSHLPKLVSVNQVLAPLCKDAAQAIGLPQGLPVVSCATDKACEVVGSGCINSDQACLSFGTAATVNVTSERYVEVERFVPAYPAALHNKFLCEIQTHRGFWLVNWFKQEFAGEEIRTANAQSVTPESLFDQLLKSTDPGANGLIAQPYWSPGVRVPGPEARGALIGFNGSHTRAHVYRALLEGLIYSLREGLEKICRKTKKPISLVRVAGGGSQSDQVLQLTADIFGLPVERNLEFEASSVGVAVCCAVATGHFTDVETAVIKMCHAGDRVDPHTESSRIHSQVYQEVYRPMYSRLKPLYLRMFSHQRAKTK